MAEQDILKEWPELEREDIRQALAYAAWSTNEHVLEVSGASG